MKEAADRENERRSKDGLPPLEHLFPGYGSNDAQGDLKRTWQAICKDAGLVTFASMTLDIRSRRFSSAAATTCH